MSKPNKSNRGRPNEGRERIGAHVLPETHKAITSKVDKTDPASNTIGKVIDALVGKPARKKGK